MAAESSEGEEETKLSGGSLLLTVDDDLTEMGKKAAWSVSSCKPGNGVSSLRDDNLETYWQSDGGQPHLVNIQFQKKVRLQLIVLYVDFKLDESYTPSKVSIRAGDGFHNLKEIKTVELVKPTGWVYLSLSGVDPRLEITELRCIGMMKSDLLPAFDHIVFGALSVLLNIFFDNLHKLLRPREAHHGSTIRHNGMFIWQSFSLPPCSAIHH
ncbi:anaphase-promoting complex subunit 10-like isoform X1 [Glycine soja]|uniref:anaphase-promoting complex subunit 10-like isoform X1 n=1 Tax=Glycine max TaxID=3847 RepID=UPI00023BDBA6|nr:uncharacterized protein LOC100806981 isoform X1 [Glycine max]XP_028197221.1 anaphase-promoting complex subunit 10-like isoform X1 [Glycine soja]|eukprot:XP_014619015.1 uncharacterized protein LOC100806981 isoform X1 [Glycine max]